MSNGAFPFRAAKPKGAPSNKPSMSFELPAAPPVEKPAPPEVQFNPEETHLGRPPEDAAETETIEQEEDVAKKKRGRPAVKKTPTPRASRTTTSPVTRAARFTFAEVVEVLGEDVPFVKVVAKITPIIEILKPDDRRRVVDILVRLYG